MIDKNVKKILHLIDDEVIGQRIHDQYRDEFRERQAEFIERMKEKYELDFLELGVDDFLYEMDFTRKGMKSDFEKWRDDLLSGKFDKKDNNIDDAKIVLMMVATLAVGYKIVEVLESLISGLGIFAMCALMVYLSTVLHTGGVG